MKRLIIITAFILCLAAGADLAQAGAAEYYCGSEEELTEALRSAAASGADSIGIQCGSEVFGRIKNSGFGLLNVCELKGGILDADIRYSENGYLEFTNIEYGGMLWQECCSEEDISAAIRRMGEENADEFALILDEETYEKMSADEFALLRDAEARGGMVSSSMSYNYRAFILYYSDFRIVSDSKVLNSLDEAIEYVAGASAKGEEDIILFCTESLFDQLMGDAVNSEEGERGNEKIYDLTVRGGIFDYEISYYYTTHIIIIHVNDYYPGTKIVNAYNAWLADPDTDNTAETGSFLTDIEQKTFKKAFLIAGRCTADTQLQTAYNIHNYLCWLVEYADDDDIFEDDTAIGAILMGRANCDGYADAFHLISALAGLETSYVHGNSPDRTDADQDMVNHMWNFLKLNGSWRLVDVTWDDDETGWKYTWFNLGYDKASRMHNWNTDMYPELMPETDLSERPENEYHVYSFQQAVESVDLAEDLKLNDFIIVFENEESAAYLNDVLNAVSRRAIGSYSYHWDDIMLELDIIDVEMY